jgi:cytidylate kinase
MRHENGAQQVYLNGVNVGDTIRTPEVAAVASTVSAIPEVRTFLLALQRNIAKEKNVIMDGRDIGTVILPDAQVKIFLSASMEARAKRRHLELMEKGVETSYEEILKSMIERDTKDSTRETAPAVPADDAIHLDNSDLNPDQTLDAALNIIRSKI